LNPRPFLGDGCFQDSYLKPLSHLSVKWQTYLDLNKDRKSQNLSCFHYTIGLWLLSVVTIHAHLINSQGYSPEYERAKVEPRDGNAPSTRLWKSLMYLSTPSRQFSFNKTCMAKAVGLEPTTFGFGVRCSTN